MEELAKRWVGDAVFAVVYTKEPHPNQGAFMQYDQHRTLQDRRTFAEELTEEFGMERVVLLDTMDNAAQEAYGGLPNMQFVIDETGHIQMQLAWAEARRIERWLEERSPSHVSS